MAGLPDVAIADVEQGQLIVPVEHGGRRLECVGCGQVPQVKDRVLL
jgi:hypothetical protein